MRYAELIERKSHGTPGFPIQYYYVDKTHPQYVMQTHWHKEFELIRVLKGNLTAFLDNTPYFLSKGDVLFVPCTSLHRATPGDCVYECLVFDLNMLARRSGDVAEKYVLPLVNDSVNIDCVLSQNDPAFYQTVNAVFLAMREREKHNELEILGLLFSVFGLLYARGRITNKMKVTHRKSAVAVTKVIDWIQENYKSHITLEELSRISGVNQKYLCRIFKEYTSKTPVSYINELRIENACHEITFGEKNITKAAFDNGFNDSGYFSKIFKEKKGITPKEYQLLSRTKTVPEK